MTKVSPFMRILLFILTVIPTVLFAQTEKQLIYKLQEGESLVYGENCFSLNSEKTDVYFIVVQNGKYFTIENGIKKGPFSSISEDMIKGCGSQSNNLCSRFNIDDCNIDKDASKYISTDESFRPVIKFNGKTYGPYLSILQFNQPCSGDGFMAIVMTDDNKIKFVSSNGKTIDLQGSAEWITLSPDGKAGLIGLGMAIDPTNIDISKINVEEMNKYTVIDLDGKVMGRYDRTQVNAADFWFCKSGGNHWFMHNNAGEYYRDGQLFKNLPANYGVCDLWFSEDGKRIAVVDYGQSEFAETSEIWKIKNPLQLNYFQKDGKTWIKWISLENDKELVLSKRAL